MAKDAPKPTRYNGPLAYGVMSSGIEWANWREFQTMMGEAVKKMPYIRFAELCGLDALSSRVLAGKHTDDHVARHVPDRVEYEQNKLEIAKQFFMPYKEQGILVHPGNYGNAINSPVDREQQLYLVKLLHMGNGGEAGLTLHGFTGGTRRSEEADLRDAIVFHYVTQRLNMEIAEALGTKPLRIGDETCLAQGAYEVAQESDMRAPWPLRNVTATMGNRAAIAYALSKNDIDPGLFDTVWDPHHNLTAGQQDASGALVRALTHYKNLLSSVTFMHGKESIGMFTPDGKYRPEILAALYDWGGPFRPGRIAAEGSAINALFKKVGAAVGENHWGQAYDGAPLLPDEHTKRMVNVFRDHGYGPGKRFDGVATEDETGEKAAANANKDKGVVFGDWATGFETLKDVLQPGGEEPDLTDRVKLIKIREDIPEELLNLSWTDAVKRYMPDFKPPEQFVWVA